MTLRTLFFCQGDFSRYGELLNLLDHMRALFDAIGSAENMEEDIRTELGHLGANVASAARRQWQLWDGAVRALDEQRPRWWPKWQQNKRREKPYGNKD